MTNTQKKSLGRLRPQKKTKPRSPELIGNITIQEGHLATFVEQLEESGATELVAGIAAWKYQDDEGFYLSVELSPKFTARSNKMPKELSVLDFMEDEE